MSARLMISLVILVGLVWFPAVRAEDAPGCPKGGRILDAVVGFGQL